MNEMDRHEIDGFIVWVPKGVVFDAHAEAKRIAKIKESCEKFEKEFKEREYEKS